MKRVFLVSVAVLLLTPAAARAETFCVPVACGGTTEPSLTDAVAASNVNGVNTRDTIVVGPGTFNTDTVLVADDNPVDIVGSGTGQGGTRLIANASQPVVLVLGTTSTVSDLALELGADSTTGVELDGKATRILVEDGSGNQANLGVIARGGSVISDSRVLFPLGGNATAIDATPNAGQSVTVSRVVAAGQRGVRTEGGPNSVVNVTQSTFNAAFDGATNTDGGTLRISSSVITMNGPGTGLSAAHVGGANTASVAARNVTVIGDGTSGSVGAAADASDGTATLDLRSAIVQGFEHSLQRSGVAGQGTSNLAISYSDLNPNTAVIDVNGLGGTFAPGAGNTPVDPGFAGVNDFHLASTSPLIDQGDPAPLGAFDSSLDVFGLPRLNDGDGDGTARADIGAAEFQRPSTTTPPGNTPGASMPASPPPPATSKPKDTIAPVLSSVSLTRRTFQAGTKSTAVTAAASGTTVRFRLSEPAVVRIAVERRTTGASVKRGKRRVCAPRTRGRRKAARCARYVGVRTLTRSGKSGRNAVAFSGRIGGRKLTAGPYRFSIVATDASGNRSKPRTVAFRIR